MELSLPCDKVLCDEEWKEQRMVSFAKRYHINVLTIPRLCHEKDRLLPEVRNIASDFVAMRQRSHPRELEV